MEYLFELSKFLKYFIIVQIFTFTITHDFNLSVKFRGLKIVIRAECSNRARIKANLRREGKRERSLFPSYLKLVLIHSPGRALSLSLSLARARREARRFHVIKLFAVARVKLSRGGISSYLRSGE